MSLPLRRFTGLVYRAHNPRWAFTPESGEGARRHGGRFNRPGTPALYMSLALETAWLEAQQGFPFKAQPMTMCAYRVDCAAVLDLTDPAVRDAADASISDLACRWEDLAGRRQPVPTWSLAETWTAKGASAAITPSFAPGATERDRNLVFWIWGPEGDSRVEVVDDFGRLGGDPQGLG